MGRPGIGKTTMLREAARVLADDLGKRVVVVDTSNEIAGDGDIPHPAIGKARRMQVRTPSLQHEVMIEAVENHMPQVIVIDEIGTELEAQAARTIAERGVQLIGTAHGNNLDNLMLNPTLSDLIGGIQSVTLGDEEARRRRTQKSVLERKAPPTFDVIIEIQDRERVMVHATSPRRSTRCSAASRSRRSCAGATRKASIAPSRGRARRRASSSARERFAGLVGAGSRGAWSRAGVARVPTDRPTAERRAPDRAPDPPADSRSPTRHSSRARSPTAARWSGQARLPPLRRAARARRASWIATASGATRRAARSRRSRRRRGRGR
jgi:nucleoside-triphosphatase THEP1